MTQNIINPNSPAAGGLVTDNRRDEAIDGQGFDQQVANGDAAPKGTKLRIMAANTTSGPYQSYDPGHGTRMFEALKPDVVLVQEFQLKNGSLDDYVRDTFGEEYSYYQEPGKTLPNGVISRFPIKDAGVWDDPQMDNREFVWAQIDVPGTDKDLWAISLHLKAGGAAGRREAEGEALIDYVRNFVPPGDYMTIGGDLNIQKFSEPVMDTLSQVVEVDASKQPVGADDLPGTNASRKKPYDQVLHDADLGQHEVPVEIKGKSYENGYVYDSRVEHIAPSQPGDSGASNMQHMPVIRDYVIPGDGEATAGNVGGDGIGNNGGVDAGDVDLDNGIDDAIAGGDDLIDTDGGDIAVIDSGDSGADANAAGGQGKPRVAIASALPNPDGGDTGNEQVTLRNDGDEPISLAGWKLMDRNGDEAWLEGEIAPGETFTLTLDAGEMPLSNSGDSISLVDLAGNVVHEVSYSKGQINSGEAIEFDAPDYGDNANG